jgi:hypothetical protein
MVGWLVNSDLERLWNESVVFQLEVVFWHLPGGTIGNHKKPWSGWAFSDLRYVTKNKV